MKQISQLIREIIPVIIGILIALVINNWNEDRKEKKYLNQIFSSLKSELEESSKDIKESLPKQQRLVDSLEVFLKDETVSVFDIIGKAGGINGPNIKNNAWTAIANTKIELVEFEKISMLSEIDKSKERIEFKEEKILDFVIANLKSTSEEKKELFRLLTIEIMSTEKYLQKEIEEFIKK